MNNFGGFVIVSDRLLYTDRTWYMNCKGMYITLQILMYYCSLLTDILLYVNQMCFSACFKRSEQYNTRISVCTLLPVK